MIELSVESTNLEVRKVHYSCGKIALGLVGTKMSRRDSAVKRIVYPEQVNVALARVEALAEEKAEAIALSEPEVVEPVEPKSLKIIYKKNGCIAYTHGIICGGTSVKTSNREVRDCYDSCISKRHARRARRLGWKFEQRRAEKTWQWQKWRRKDKKNVMMNREILLTQ